MSNVKSLQLNRENKHKRVKRSSQRVAGQRAAAGFTLIELLIVIVVIAILAAIAVVAYRGIQTRAAESGLKSDLRTASKELAITKTEDGDYPGDDSGLSKSPNTNYEYDMENSSYCLTATSTKNSKAKAFHVKNGGAIQEGPCEGHSGPSQGGGGEGGSGDSNIPSITIGSQTWMAHNLNVGTMIPGSTNQTDNNTIEKYCYDNDEANCDQYGGLYQWNEAMQYTTTESAQGICPSGWHIPSDNEWKTLEMALGMTPAQADATGSRGTDQGTQLKPGGSSGLDIPLGGYRLASGSFAFHGPIANVWSSSESGSGAWRRNLYSGNADVDRSTGSQTYGFAVRCLKN